mgnify:FL=1|tara:strand:- start:968 stop:1228 length:261 start_codon:yes stop_codon:yes gene_type:complete
MTYIIEKNIPLPPTNNRGREKSELWYAVEKMEIGDSIVISEKDHKQISQMTRNLKIASVGKRLNENQWRIWRKAELNTYKKSKGQK